MLKDNERQQPSFYQQISEANPLQKRSLKAPLSIFPLVQLPQFKYSQEQLPLLQAFKQTSFSPQKTHIRTRSTSPKKKIPKKTNPIFLVYQTELKILFENPLYTYSKRLSKGSNKNFCNIKVFPQESHSHQNIKETSLTGDHEQNLTFQSRFQSGNLAMVTKSRLFDNEYYLLLTKDFNTARCTQWFFFRISNAKKGKYTFHILNFFKNYSAFQYGMQICVATKSTNYAWTRAGQNIQYRKTNIRNDLRHMYCLSFTFDFKHNQDITFFSYSYAYTYSKLDRFLFFLEEENQSILKRRSIGNSLGGNSIDMLTITNFKTSSNDKRLIFITARVHPGQTPSSFVMEGIIKQLIENTAQMQNARQKFIFKLIPMLNPDGVINGNYRCSFSGNDLNRIWNSCNKDKFPEIYAVRKALQSSKRPFLYIDLHAHSKKKGVFMYGCTMKNNPFLCRQIPFLLWKNIPQFNYYQCSFSINSKQRQGTARMNLFSEFGVTLSYTMQHSFCGPLKIRRHFTAKDYEKIGANLVLTIEKIYGRRRKQNNQTQDDFLKQLYENKELLKVGEGQDNDSSSDSELDAQFQVELQENKKEKRLEKFRPKQKLNIQSINDNLTIKTPRQKFCNNFIFSRSSSFRQKATSQVRIMSKKNISAHMSRIGFPTDEFSKREESRLQSPDRNRQCYSSLKRQQDQNLKSKKFLKHTARYSEDEVNNLTNLFLPSVTSSSYKKYNKPKAPNKGLVHVGRKFLENAGILKDQIKSALKRKIQWKTTGQTFLG